MADVSKVAKHVPDRFRALNHDFGPSGAKRVLVVGDSYAQDFINATFESNASGSAEFSTIFISWDCQIYFGTAPVDEFIEPRFRPECVKEHAADGLAERLPRADIVFLIGSWRPWAIERLPQSISALKLRPDQLIFVIGPKNFGEIDIRKLLSVQADARPGIRQQPSAAAVKLNQQLRETLASDVFVDLLDMACGPDASCPIFTNEGDLISFDGAHLTPAGARWLGTRIWSSALLHGVLTARH